MCKIVAGSCCSFTRYSQQISCLSANCCVFNCCMPHHCAHMYMHHTPCICIYTHMVVGLLFESIHVVCNPEPPSFGQELRSAHLQHKTELPVGFSSRKVAQSLAHISLLTQGFLYTAGWAIREILVKWNRFSSCSSSRTLNHSTLFAPCPWSAK